MGMIKGFYLDKDGQVQTYWAKEEIHDPVVPMSREEKRKNHIRCNAVRASVILAVMGAMGFTMTLAAPDPNWAVGIGGVAVNMAWVLTVLIANGGKINVSNDR